MSDFHPIKVAAIHKETKDTVAVTFDIPDELKSTFQFTQGQYLTLRKEIDGEDVRRSYSLCTSPAEGRWQVAIKQIAGGVFSTYANSILQAGDTLGIMPPAGNFFIKVDPTKPKNYIAFAAGSGITPMLSIIKTHLAEEPNSTFKLFYVNRTAKSIIFKEELEQLKNIYLQRFNIFYFFTKEHRDIHFLNGRFDQEKMQLLTKSIFNVNDISDCFICGPKEMIFLIRDELVAAGLEKEKVHYELFFSGDNDANDAQVAEILEKKVDGTEVTVIDGGKEFHFVMDDDHDNILDGALASGADLSYACKGGVCCTCKCKILEGSAEMKVNYALEEDEVAQNYILSCQAVPTSEKVVVDFDV